MSCSIPPMRVPPDYHMHTPWSNHGTGTMEDYTRRAIEIGLEEIGFSPHLPITVPSREKLTLYPEEMPLFDRELRRLRESYGSQVIIRYGGEADFLPGAEAEIEALIKEYPFDYLICSVHYIGEWGFDNPAHADEFERRELREVYNNYFTLLSSAIRTGFFDIVGHFDLVKKFGHRLEPLETYEELLDLIAESRMCIELNTSGKEKPVAEFYPTKRVLELAHERGIPLTFGSDAHAPGEVARYFEEAKLLALSAGYREVASFECRKRKSLPLEN